MINDAVCRKGIGEAAMFYPKRLDVSRRGFLNSSAIGVAASGAAMRSKLSFAQAKTVEIGFLATLIGEVPRRVCRALVIGAITAFGNTTFS